MGEARAGEALLVERALRRAARSGNRLLAGSGARVAVADPGVRRRLESALRRAGARLAPGAPADFAFVDAVPGSGSEPGPGAGSEPGSAAARDAGAEPGAGLPVTLVPLGDETRGPRGADAAARIAWAAAGMPATAALAERLREAGAGRAPRVAVSLVLEPKTAALALALARAGCAVAVFSAVSETDPSVAAALAADGRVRVFAPTAPVDAREAAAIDAEHAAAALAWGPELLIDDGAHLIRLAHTEHPAALGTLRAAAEETTSGVRPLREMAAEGALRIPVIAVNDARTKTDFDNRVGTGQSCVFAIADLLDAAGWRAPGAPGLPGDRGGAAADGRGADDDPGYAGMAGTRWAVIGYGPVGEGVARYAAVLGAVVTVVERDPVRALAALHDGFEACGADEALASADVVVSATGVWHTLDAGGFARLRPGAAVAIAGGIDDELALDELRAGGWSEREAAAGVAEWRAPGASAGPLVLAGGGGVNYTAAEGNPIEVMDLSFATQLAALIRLVRGAPGPGVHALSAEDERLVARAALAARGGTADDAGDPGRPGGAAQAWTVHRYRSRPGALDSSE